MTTATEIETLAKMVTWPVKIGDLSYDRLEGTFTTSSGKELAVFSNDKGQRLVLTLADADDALRGRLRNNEDALSRTGRPHGWHLEDDPPSWPGRTWKGRAGHGD